MKRLTRRGDMFAKIGMMSFVCAAGTAGCTTPVQLRCPDDTTHFRGANTARNFGTFHDMPRRRIGSLPFPGLFTLYTAADPTDLGHHRYGRGKRGQKAEVGRGVFYTCRGGFLDVTHIRLAGDLTAYVLPRIRLALDAGWTCIQIRGHEPSIFRVAFDYPAVWYRMEHDERQDLIDELSVRLSMRLAYTMATWHEFLTWYGYKSTVVFPETGSAFTYEDTTSHALGVLVAGEALRERMRTGVDYDAAFTIALNSMIDELEPVDRSTQREITRAIEGDWWNNGFPVKRHLDLGFDDGIIEPWLAYRDDSREEHEPYAFVLPAIDVVNDVPLEDFLEVGIAPNVLETFWIMNVIPDDDGRVYPSRDFEILAESIRASLGEKKTSLMADPTPDPTSDLAPDSGG